MCHLKLMLYSVTFVVKEAKTIQLLKDTVTVKGYFEAKKVEILHLPVKGFTRTKNECER